MKNAEALRQAPDGIRKVFSGAFTGNALVDRLTYNAYLVNMNGVSYRLKETKDFNQKIQKKDG
ncbi:hypothetical protein [uncultured Prevotella sp.]|uniref:hypothetical protein n=1 Tax=uncultured Prevotella sp. TaxID=159272 RepID=UPI002587A477|nr:hypothetical protein [uncultured Prevotella sp.]